MSANERKARSGDTKQLVVILHGWGADGANLIDLADLWANQLPDAHFCAPNAEETCEMNPFGFQWFSLADRSPAAMFAGVRRAAEQVNAFIDAKLKELSAHGNDHINVALAGFSQGTMTALHVGLRRADISCILGYSGALLEDEVSIQTISYKPPICLIHGEQDDIVPFASMARANQLLKSVGAHVETHARKGLTHSIDMEGIAIGAKFFSGYLPS